MPSLRAEENSCYFLLIQETDNFVLVWIFIVTALLRQIQIMVETGFSHPCWAPISGIRANQLQEARYKMHTKIIANVRISA